MIDAQENGPEQRLAWTADELEEDHQLFLASNEETTNVLTMTDFDKELGESKNENIGNVPIPACPGRRVTLRTTPCTLMHGL